MILSPYVGFISSPPTAGKRGRPAALRGEVASLSDLPSGCRFRTRCPLAIPRCAEAGPQLRPVGPGHLVACHRSDETATLLSEPPPNPRPPPATP